MTDDDDLELGPEDVVELPITDVLDLHGFPPGVQREVLASWLDEVWEAGFASVRVIHGKGIGVQREAVRSRLARDPRVASFGDAPGEHGGWGATLVRFRR